MRVYRVKFPGWSGVEVKAFNVEGAIKVAKYIFAEQYDLSIVGEPYVVEVK